MSLFRRNGDSALIERRIRQVIEDVRPIMRIELLGIELVRFERDTGVAVLRFHGDCPDCQLSAGMLRSGVEAHIRLQVPEVREVRAI